MIVVVTGLPRSGTSLVMQMLQSGGYPVLSDEHRPPDEDNPRGYLEDERVKKLPHDVSWLREANGRAIKIVSPLLSYLPATFEYRVIFVERNLTEVIRSQQAMLARRKKEGANASPERLKSAYEHHLKEIFAYLESQLNCPILRVEYRKLVEEPRVWAQRISDFLGGELNVDAMVSVVDPKLHRQRAD